MISWPGPCKTCWAMQREAAAAATLPTLPGFSVVVCFQTRFAWGQVSRLFSKVLVCVGAFFFF